MWKNLSVILIILSVMISCKTDPSLELSEREMELTSQVEALREKLTQFDRIQLIRDHEFEHGLLLALTIRKRCCRTARPCPSINLTAAEDFAADLMLSIGNPPVFKSFDGLIFEINDVTIDETRQ